MVVKNLDLHAVRSGRVCVLLRWLSGVFHSNEGQSDFPNKVGVVGIAQCDGGGAFVFYRYFSCSFVSARGLRLSGAGGDIGVGYAVLIFEWLTRVARGSNFFEVFRPK